MRRARGGRLASELLLGAGASVGAGLPRWQALLTALAERDDVPLSAEEVGQLATLSFEDQASVLSARLAASSGGGNGSGRVPCRLAVSKYLPN
mgnify:CR=1 FL=1